MVQFDSFSGVIQNPHGAEVLRQAGCENFLTMVFSSPSGIKRTPGELNCTPFVGQYSLFPEVSAGIAGFLQMGKSGAARAEFNAASAYTQRRKQRKSNVAKRLQETRLKCGLKQQDVAERTGINVVTLSGYEIGKNEPNMEALVSLADVYGVTLDYLMCRTDS